MSALRLLLLLVLLTAMYAIGLWLLASHSHTTHLESTDLLWGFEFRTLLAIWVRMDRRTREVRLPFEFEAFVFFGWPVAIPYYLYQTRGRRGLAIFAVVCALYVAPAVVSSILRLLA